MRLSGGDPVVLAGRPSGGAQEVGIEVAGRLQPGQRGIHGAFGEVLEAVLLQSGDDAVAVAVTLVEQLQQEQPEHPLIICGSCVVMAMRV